MERIKLLILMLVAGVVLASCGDVPATDTTTGSTTTTTTTGTTALPGVITMSSLVFGANPLSANGTTSVTVDVYSDGTLITTPTDVSFSSVCSSAGKAQLTAVGTTSSGSAVVSYVDQGCAGTDTVTAKVGSVTVSGSLTVLAPNVGSIRFIAATPSNITLKGTGGAGLQETSRVQFQVVDDVGNPLSGVTINFALNTTVGGLSLVSSTGISDGSGFAFADVQAGTVATPVRVTATYVGTASTLSTQSDALVVSTGIPDQDSMSVSASIHNIEGWGFDGETSVITVRLSDHFNNPVPDGTTVYFTTEGGQVVSSCQTSAGACEVNLISQNPRPNNGRVTVLVYAIGEESFIDLDGDGYVSQASELFDINAVSTDIGEAFRDDNENGVLDVNEPPVDFNQDGIYNAPDGVYNGILCKQGVSAQCPAGTPQSLHIFLNHTFLFSGSFAITPTGLPANINLDAVPGPVGSGCGGTQTFSFLIADLHNNEMPAGTTVDIATDNGTLVGKTAFVVGDSTNQYIPGVDTNFTFSIKGDGTYDAVANTCTDTTTSGIVTVTVTTPKNNVTLFQVPVSF